MMQWIVGWKPCGLQLKIHKGTASLTSDPYSDVTRSNCGFFDCVARITTQEGRFECFSGMILSALLVVCLTGLGG